MNNKNKETLFTASAYLLDLDTVDPVIRKTLAPLYETYPDRLRFDHSWICCGASGPVTAIKKLGYSNEKNDRIFGRLAIKAILDHPIRFVLGQFADLGRYIVIGPKKPPVPFPFSKFDFYHRGIHSYVDNVKRIPKSKELINYQVAEHDDYFQKVADASLYPFEKGNFISFLLWPMIGLNLFIPVLGILLAIGLLCKKEVRSKGLVLLLCLFGHLLMCNIGGGIDARYALPVEPLYVLLIFAGMRSLLANKRL